MMKNKKKKPVLTNLVGIWKEAVTVGNFNLPIPNVIAMEKIALKGQKNCYEVVLEDSLALRGGLIVPGTVLKINEKFYQVIGAKTNGHE